MKIYVKSSTDSIISNIDWYSESPEYLRELASHSSYKIRSQVACARNTPIDVLIKLSKDHTAAVRMYVAQHPSIPIDVLIKLSKDRSLAVREAVASNYRTPTYILESLCEDDPSDIVRRLASYTLRKMSS